MKKNKGWKRLRDAMGERTPYSVALDCDRVGHQSIVNLMTGLTEPCRVSVETATQLCEALPDLFLEDFQP